MTDKLFSIHMIAEWFHEKEPMSDKSAKADLLCRGMRLGALLHRSIINDDQFRRNEFMDIFRTKLYARCRDCG